MDIFQLSELFREQESSNRLYREFLRVSALSAGLYVLPAGGTDPQRPHAEDEVYYVISGRGFIRIDQEDRAVEAGTVVFVKAHAVHRFHSISEELVLLVFFAPAEGSCD